MKIGIISDIHSNATALRAVLDDIDTDMLLCAGDVIGYNAEPNEVIDLLRDHDATCVMGNHDAAAVGLLRFTGMPKTAVVHNTEALTDDNFAYLRSMRSQYRDRIDGLELYMVHGSPNNKFRDYVHDVDDTIFEAFEHPPDVLILGHTHIPLNTLHDHTLVINPGSVGQPRDGNPDASYAILDTETREATHHRVTYDIDATADKTKDEIAVKYGTRLYEGK